MNLIERWKNRCYVLVKLKEGGIELKRGYIDKEHVVIKDKAYRIVTEPVQFKRRKLFAIEEGKTETALIRFDTRNLGEFTPETERNIIDETIWKSLLTIQKTPFSKVLMYMAMGVGAYYFLRLILVEFLLPIVTGGA